MAHEAWHEREELLSAETRERHRALISLMEELEAADWYEQRVDATGDDELRAILAHHRDEEKEHAAMILEWLRRRDPVLDRELRTYLFQRLPPSEREHADERAPAWDGRLRIGSLRDDDDDDEEDA